MLFVVAVLLLFIVLGVSVLRAAAQDPQPVVHAVLFYSPSCSHCQYVIDEVLPIVNQILDGQQPTHARLAVSVSDVQSDSLSLDMEGTLRAYADIVARRERLIEDECHAVARLQPALVFADIPALAFDIAARLGVPSIGMTNFSWDWIYRHLAGRQPSLAASAVRAAGASSRSRVAATRARKSSISVAVRCGWAARIWS